MADEIDTEELEQVISSDKEQIVTLNQLKQYDNKKGTAVVDGELPTTVENRTYRNVDDTDATKTQVWVKSTEMETKAQADELANHYVKYVTALPSPVDTDVVYGIDHTYSQDIDSKYLVQDFISTFMKKQSNNAWLLNDSVTSTYATITYDGTDYEFNKLYWTGKRYVTYIWDESTGTSTRVGNFGIQIGDLWNYKLTWNYQHKDYYVSDSTNAKATKLANMEQVQDWYLKKEELGKANGVAVLDGDGKIPKNELNFTALNYLGMTHTWPEDEDPEAGDFYIVDEEFTHDTTTLEPGDWIIYFTSWEVESNNVIVSSVNGKIGTVVLTGDDINVTYEDVTDTINNTLPKLGKVNTVNGIEPDSNKNVCITYLKCQSTDNNYGLVCANTGSAVLYTSQCTTAGRNWSCVAANTNNVTIQSCYYNADSIINLCADKLNICTTYVTPWLNGCPMIKTINSCYPSDNGNIDIDGDDINVTYESVTDTLNNTLPKLGKLKTVNSIEPDDDGNVDVDSMQLTYLADCNDVSGVTVDRQMRTYYITSATTNRPGTLSNYGVLTIYRVRSDLYVENYYEAEVGYIYSRYYKTDTWYNWTKKPFQAIRDFGSTSTDVFTVLSSYLDGLMTKANLIIKGTALVNNPDGSTGTSFLYMLDSSSNANYAVCKAYNLGKGLEYVSYLAEGTWGAWSLSGTPISDTVDTSTTDVYSHNGIRSILLPYVNITNNNRSESFTGDLNTIVKNSKYCCDANNTSNKPNIDGWFFCETNVWTSGNYETQFITPMNSSELLKTCWYRVMTNGTWGAWIQLDSCHNHTSGGNILDIIKSTLTSSTSTHCTLRAIGNYSNTPYGTSSVSCDFIYEIFGITDAAYAAVIAHDVRVNRSYRNAYIGGTWKGWTSFIEGSYSNGVLTLNI